MNAGDLPVQADTAAELGAITWQLPAYAAFWLPEADLSAFAAWMTDNSVDDVSERDSVEVSGGQITYGQDCSPTGVRAAQRDIVTITTPLCTPPPMIAGPGCSPAELAALQTVLAEHEWSDGFDGVCVDCSTTQTDQTGRIWCHRDDAVPWPCPPVRGALVRAGFGVPDGQAGRILGDCLDPADNARAGLAVPPSGDPAGGTR